MMMNQRSVATSGYVGLAAGLGAMLSVSLAPERAVLNTVLAGASLASLLIFFVGHFEAFKAFSRKRSTQFGLNSILMVLLFLFMVVIFNLIIKQHYFRFDLSATGRYSLAPQTKSVIQRLDSRVEVIIFGREGGEEFKRARDMLESGQFLNRYLSYSLIDLDREPQLAQRYGVTQYNQTVARAAGSSAVVRGIDELAIANALITATRREKKKVLFSSGHGELDVADTSRVGISRAFSSLRSLGYETATIALSGVEAVPEHAAVLVIAGPKQRFGREDVAKVRRYLSVGGKVLALFDPGYDVRLLLEFAGVSLGNGVIVDPDSNLDGLDAKVPAVTIYPDTPVTRDFRLTTVYPGAAPVKLTGKGKEYEFLQIVKTSRSSRLVKDGMTVDAQGEYIIAGAAGSRTGKDTLLVFGNSGFVSNVYFDSTGNGNLFLNCVNWLAGESELVSIAPRKEDFVPIYLTPEQGRILFFTAPVGIPLSIFACGFVIWWRRRSL